jgi:hypothetical protein
VIGDYPFKLKVCYIGVLKKKSSTSEKYVYIPASAGLCGLA